MSMLQSTCLIEFHSIAVTREIDIGIGVSALQQTGGAASFFSCGFLGEYAGQLATSRSQVQPEALTRHVTTCRRKLDAYRSHEKGLVGIGSLGMNPWRLRGEHIA